MAEIVNKGQELNLTIRQGATFGPITCTLTNQDTSPVNITGFTFRAHVRKTPISRKATGFAATCAVVNGAAGQFSFEFTDDNTAALQAGDTENDADSLYYWDMEMEQGDGRVVPLVYGTVKVFREVTKAV